jgi:uncharacterized protein DUF222
LHGFRVPKPGIRIEHVFDDLVSETSGADGPAAVGAWARVENAACAHRLSVMVAMLDAAYAADGSADRDLWCIDNWAAVTAQIGAAQRQTRWAASAVLLVALAVRERFPKIGQVFSDGLIGYPMVRLLVTRASAIVDPKVWAALDAAMAQLFATGKPMSLNTLEKAIDAKIWELDPLAVHHTQTRARDRHVDVVTDDETGVAQLFGSLFAADGHALSQRLDALAATVCSHDPRTKEQRRADAVGPLSHGADRLACLCERKDCLAALRPPSTGVVIHLVAHHDTIAGPTTPADPVDDPGPAPDAPHGPVDLHNGLSDAKRTDTATSADAETEIEGLTGDPDTDADAGPGTGIATEVDCSSANRASAPIAPADECAALDGAQPPVLTKPLRELTWGELFTSLIPRPEHLTGIPPATIIGGATLPGAIARRAARGATLSVIVHPGQAPPENRYTPSRKLAEFVRCRDLTCRYPGCKKPATDCDIDHTIPYPYGPTAASNLKCLCRWHHLVKTFWGSILGWRDRQLPDGTVIWTTRDGRTHTTEPGSRQLFPQLCDPTAPVPACPVPPDYAKGLKMPRRRATRKQDRARRVLEEREFNRMAIAEEIPLAIARIKRDAERAAAQAEADLPPF